MGKNSGFPQPQNRKKIHKTQCGIQYPLARTLKFRLNEDLVPFCKNYMCIYSGIC